MVSKIKLNNSFASPHYWTLAALTKSARLIRQKGTQSRGYTVARGGGINHTKKDKDRSMTRHALSVCECLTRFDQFPESEKGISRITTLATGYRDTKKRDHHEFEKYYARCTSVATRLHGRFCWKCKTAFLCK